MNKNLVILFFFFCLNSYSQDLFEYEFDENLIINVLEDSEEGEMPNGKFVRSSFSNELIIFSKSDKAKEQLNDINEKSLVKLYEGIKDGVVNSTKGKFISEKFISLDNLKIYSFRVAFKANGKRKIVENYSFVYKSIIYTYQFMNDEDDFDTNNDFREELLKSIKFL